jgi:hypothetical protein
MDQYVVFDLVSAHRSNVERFYVSEFSKHENDLAVELPTNTFCFRVLEERKGGPVEMSSFNVLSHVGRAQDVKAHFRARLYQRILFYRPFCHLMRCIRLLCASWLFLSRGILEAWSLRKIFFAVTHAAVISKILNVASPSGRLRTADTRLDVRGGTVVGFSRLRHCC